MHFDRMKLEAELGDMVGHGEEFWLREAAAIESARRSAGLHGRRVLTADQHKLHEPDLDLADFIVNEQEAPASISRTLPPFGDAWLNNTLGDCGEAMTLNGIQTFHSVNGTHIPAFTDHDAEVLYEQVGGYDPNAPLVDGQNPTDQGTDNKVLMQKWKNPGVTCAADGTQHTIAASLFVDPANENLTKLAIWEFICCFRAYGLPKSAESEIGVWRLIDNGEGADGKLGSWGYHDIAQQGYNPRGIRLKTWGMPWLATWDFDKTYGVQGVVVVTKEQLNLEGVSPAGVDWTALNAAIGKLPSVPAS